MTPFEFLYYIGYSLKKIHSYKRQKRLPYPVVSIGNITVGGTGKTPSAIAIAEEAKKRGFYPIILTRGYKGKTKGPCFVLARKFESAGAKDFYASGLSHFCTSALDAGDEPVLMAERLKDIPIVKCADRYEGGIFALDNLEFRNQNSKSKIIFILDDGFQHWRLYRDRDIVSLDGLNPFGNRRILPMGPLREPLNELRRADIFVITKIKNKALADELRNINPSAPVYFSEYRLHKVVDMDGNEYSIEILKDKRVYAFSGIANPDSFKQTVLSVCKGLSGFKGYRDHHKYKISDLKYLIGQAIKTGSDFLVATEKDMVKIRELPILDSMPHGKKILQHTTHYATRNTAIQILCLQIDFCVEPAFFDAVFRDIS